MLWHSVFPKDEMLQRPLPPHMLSARDPCTPGTQGKSMSAPITTPPPHLLTDLPLAHLSMLECEDESVLFIPTHPMPKEWLVCGGS